MKNKWYLLLVTILVLVGLLSGCTPTQGQQSAVDAPAAGVETEATAVPAATEPVETPSAVAEAFYTWYLDYIGDRSNGEFRNPLVDGAYRDSEYLTPGFIAQIDETLANMGEQGGFDPILLAQDIPVRIEVQEPSLNGDEATVVVLRYWGGNPEPSPMVVHLVQQDGRWLIDNVTPFEDVATPETAALDPAATVEAFYAWYIDYFGGDGLRTQNNPLVDGAYRDSAYLSPRFVAEVDTYAAAFNPYGYDPIFMAIYIPEQISVEEVTVDGEQATVVVQRTWSMIDNALPMKVLLRQEDGRWLIDDVTVIMPAVATADGPAEVVEAFYTWYLAYIGSAAAGEFRNPLTDAAYADSPYLTADLIAAVDAQLEEMRAKELSGSDPFLCAQNVPISVVVSGVFVQPSGPNGAPQAQVVLREGFFGPSALLVKLEPAQDAWLISAIECAGATPAGVAEMFYTGYLGYIGDRATDEFRNPLVDGVYRDSVFLTPALVQRVDELLAAPDQAKYDPFLQAQDVPHGFTTEPGPEENTAVVHFNFFGPDNEPYGGWDVLLSFVEEKGHWYIDNVARYDVAEAGDGVESAVFANDAYGFSFAYPADWVVQALDLAGPGVPDDWPVVAAWQVMPADVAAQLAAQTAPDPNAPPIVAPFEVAVVAGDKTAVARAFLPLDDAQETQIHGNTAYVLRLDPGYTHTIVPHPRRTDLWLVVTDWVTGFPGREAQAETAAPALAALLNSLEFTE